MYNYGFKIEDFFVGETVSITRFISRRERSRVCRSAWESRQHLGRRGRARRRTARWPRRWAARCRRWPRARSYCAPRSASPTYCRNPCSSPTNRASSNGYVTYAHTNTHKRILQKVMYSKIIHFFKL